MDGHFKRGVLEIFDFEQFLQGPLGQTAARDQDQQLKK